MTRIRRGAKKMTESNRDCRAIARRRFAGENRNRITSLERRKRLERRRGSDLDRRDNRSPVLRESQSKRENLIVGETGLIAIHRNHRLFAAAGREHILVERQKRKRVRLQYAIRHSQSDYRLVGRKTRRHRNSASRVCRRRDIHNHPPGKRNIVPRHFVAPFHFDIDRVKPRQQAAANHRNATAIERKQFGIGRAENRNRVGLAFIMPNLQPIS